MKVKYKHNLEAFIIYHFLDRLINKNNNNCERSYKTTLSSYNYHYPCYYSVMSIILSALLFLSSLPIPAVVTANASMSNVAIAEQQITESSLLQAKLNSNNNTIIPTAQSVYASQYMTLPTSVGTFVWYIVNEAHENSASERHKYLSDSNAIYLPTNLVIAQGTAISFLNADAPWDSPHPHTINIVDSTGKIVYSTGKMDYTNSSTPKVLPSGKYTVMDTKYTWMKGNLTVTPQNGSD